MLSSYLEVFCEKGFLKYLQKSLENTSASVSFLIKLMKKMTLAKMIIKKKTLVQMFSYETCETFKNTFSYRKLLVAVSVSVTTSYSPRNVSTLTLTCNWGSRVVL